MAQTEVAWDAAKSRTQPVEAATLSLSFVGRGARVLAASPGAPGLAPLVEIDAVRADQKTSLSAGQSGTRFALPPLGAWTVMWIPAEELAGSR